MLAAQQFVQYIMCFIVQSKFKQPHALEEQQRVLSQGQTQLRDRHSNNVRKASKDMLSYIH
jgi:hypothetical protein